VTIQGFLEVLQKCGEGSRIPAWAVCGCGDGQLVGQLAEMYVVVHQSVYPAACEALRHEGKEEALLVDCLVQHLIPQIGDEPVDLVTRPPVLGESSANGASATADLPEEDGVLVGQSMIADAVILPRSSVIRSGR
jgi:hypothetical protein